MGHGRPNRLRLRLQPHLLGVRHAITKLRRFASPDSCRARVKTKDRKILAPQLLHSYLVFCLLLFQSLLFRLPLPVPRILPARNHHIDYGQQRHRQNRRSVQQRTLQERPPPRCLLRRHLHAQGFAPAASGGFFTYVFSQLFISQNMCSTDSCPWYPCDSRGSRTKRTVAPCPFNALKSRSL